MSERDMSEREAQLMVQALSRVAGTAAVDWFRADAGEPVVCVSWSGQRAIYLRTVRHCMKYIWWLQKLHISQDGSQDGEAV